MDHLNNLRWGQHSKLYKSHHLEIIKLHPLWITKHNEIYRLRTVWPAIISIVPYVSYQPPANRETNVRKSKDKKIPPIGDYVVILKRMKNGSGASHK